MLLPSEVGDLFSLSQATRGGFAPGLGVGTANNRVTLSAQMFCAWTLLCGSAIRCCPESLGIDDLEGFFQP